jgi:hypothetical protein
MIASTLATDITVEWTAPENGGTDITSYGLEMDDVSAGYGIPSLPAPLAPLAPLAPVFSRAPPAFLPLSAALLLYPRVLLCPHCQGFRSVYNGPDTSYTCKKLKPFSRYAFRVTATNQQGASPASPAVEAMTLPALPAPAAAPVLAGQAGLDAFDVQWGANAEADMVSAYVLQLRLQAGEHAPQGSPDFVTVYDGPALTARCSGLLPGTRYALRLIARNSGGAGPCSRTVNISTVAIAPRAPVMVSAAVRFPGVHVVFKAPAWSGGADVSAYR